METDIDEYLKSDAALDQTESALGRLLHPGETFGGFRAVAFLGRGGNAEVYRVVHLSLPLQGALKILMRSEPAHVERFKRETVL